MHSIQFRLGRALFFSLLVTFALLWLLISQASRYLVEENIVSRLEHDSEILVSAISISAEKKIMIDESRVSSIYKHPFSGHYFIIATDKNIIRSRSLWDYSFKEIPAMSATAEQQRRYINGPQQQSLLALTINFHKQNKPFSIFIAEDLSTVNRQLKTLQYYFIAATLVFLIILVIIQSWILKRGLHPIEETRNELQRLSEGKQHNLNSLVPAEISPLVNEINHLLNILEQRLQRSRNAIGDLAHALKKPLTVLKQLNRDDQTPVDSQAIELQLEEIQRLVERMLQRARLAGEGPARVPFNANKEIPVLISMFEKIYREKSLSFELNIPDRVIIPVDREDMLELFGNLVDNACKWASHKLAISISPQPSFTILIEDDGPGVEVDALQDLTLRGHRLDERAEGHGLGLSIVNEIVKSYGGELSFTKSDRLGGLSVSISFSSLN